MHDQRIEIKYKNNRHNLENHRQSFIIVLCIWLILYIVLCIWQILFIVLCICLILFIVSNQLFRYSNITHFIVGDHRAYNDIVTTVGKSKVSFLFLIYFTAAFDTIDHDNLFYILDRYVGIGGSALQLTG